MASALQQAMKQGKTVIKSHRQTQNHSYTCSLDTINRRLIVHACNWRDVVPFAAELFESCRENHLDKLIVQAQESDWETLLSLGFVMEGKIESFFSGQPVYYMSKFFSEERQLSQAWMVEEEILEGVLLDRKPQKVKPLAPSWTVSRAQRSDLAEMVELFDKVFDTYPSPLTDPVYLAKSMENDIFVIIRDGKRIISAAGAEIDRTAGNAEMTNCATLPEYRRYGLMNHIFAKLEAELAKEQIRSLFSIARAKSYGMNRVLVQHGYAYCGRLVNNCDICGGFEDMNLWAKEL